MVVPSVRALPTQIRRRKVSFGDKEEAMFDLIVSGGTAVMPAGAEAADIGVSGGKIAGGNAARIYNLN